MAWTHGENATRNRILNNAANLHTKKYHAVEVVGGMFEITSPKGAVYAIDTERGGCTCGSHHRYGYCKHELGLPNLLFFQRREAKMRFEQSEHFYGRDAVATLVKATEAKAVAA